ncbi:MAG: hypothetical protein JWP63_3751 [Candidatus Solibacter sp.]|jgi:hypothetical protein|nr:hypothetical protein [Candidatus Solibacter sp.]
MCSGPDSVWNPGTARTSSPETAREERSRRTRGVLELFARFARAMVLLSDYEIAVTGRFTAARGLRLMTQTTPRYASRIPTNAPYIAGSRMSLFTSQ